MKNTLSFNGINLLVAFNSVDLAMLNVCYFFLWSDGAILAKVIENTSIGCRVIARIMSSTGFNNIPYQILHRSMPAIL